MTKKMNSYVNKTLVISIVVAALGVVALTTQDVKADQVAEAPLKTAPNKQPATNPGITTNTLEQANNVDQEAQPPAAKVPSLPPKKAIKTVADLPNPITWKSADGTDSSVTLTLKHVTDPQNLDACELDISGGEITNPKPLAGNGRSSSNGDSRGMLDEWKQFSPLITTIKVTAPLTIKGDASWLFASLGQITSMDLSQVDTSQVTDMNSMFFGCYALPNLDVSSFDTSKVTNMNNMFTYCYALTSLDLSKFDTSQVTDMSSMFLTDPLLKNLKLNGWQTSNVTDMKMMFAGCSALTSLDLSSFDTSKVTNMSGMFAACSALTRLDLSSFSTKGISRPEAMQMLLGWCNNLNTLKLGPNFVTKFTQDDYDVLELPGPIWKKVGKGSLVAPEDSNGHEGTWFNNFNGATDYGTYVRLYLADGITPTRAGDITIKYLDKGNDNKEINLPKSSELSQPYQGLLGGIITPEPEITDANGQKYLIAKDERNPKEVTFTPQPQNITLYYIKVPSVPNNANIPGGDVTVHYQDEAGHTLAPDEIIKGHVGAGYVSRTLQIAGYSLKTRPEKATGFFTNDPQSITYIYTLNKAKDETKISKQLMHSAFIYDLNHRRVGESKFYSYERIMVDPKVVTLADGAQAYKLADNQYVLAANIDGTLRKLKHNAYVYQTGKKRANRLVLRKGKVIRTYGAPYQFKNGKLYYRIGGPKRQYVKVSNFK